MMCFEKSVVLGFALALIAPSLPAGPLSQLSRVADHPLDTAIELVWSPDTRHAYIATDDGLALMERLDDGTLRLLEIYYLSQWNASRPSGNQAIALSPDGRFLYRSTGSAILALRRNTINGRLRFLEAYRNGRGGVSGIFNNRQLLVTPDGRQLLVTATDSDQLLEVFRRDTTTGLLDFVHNAFIGTPPKADGVALVQSADGRHVYIATGSDHTVALLKRRPLAARLEALASYRGGVDFPPQSMLNPIELVLSPDERFLYVLALWSEAVVVLSRDPSSGELSFVESVPPQFGGQPDLSRARSLAIDPDGRFLYVALFDNGPLVQLERQPDGRLEHSRSFDGGGIDLTQVVGVATGPLGRFVYALDYRQAGIVVRQGEGTGELSLVNSLQLLEDDMVDGLEGAGTMALSPDGHHLYVAARDDQAVVGLSVNEPEEGLPVVDVQHHSPVLGANLEDVSDLVSSPDGRHLYAAGRGGGVEIFERHAATGALQWRGRWLGVVGGLTLSQIGGLTLDSAGAHLYLVSSGDDLLVTLRRNPDNGELETLHSLSLPDNMPGLRAVQDLALSPDERFLYAAGSRIGIFERSATGHLTLADGEAPIFPANQIVLSSDGRFLYGVSNNPNDNLSIYQRHLGNGGLTLQRRLHVGISASSTTSDFNHLTLDRTQRRLYVTSIRDNALFTFDRDPTTGELTLLGTEINARFNVRGIHRPTGLVVADDGMVFVSSTGDAGVTALTPGCLDSHLCMMTGRFRVEVVYRDFADNVGLATALPTASEDSAVLWFFAEDNWEMLVKLVDGCDFNDHFWVFSSAATNIETTLRITDTWTGRTAEYLNPLGQSPVAVTDAQALATCSAMSI